MGLLPDASTMSLHPLFRVVLRRPELIAEHLANHVEHAKSQAGQAAGAFARKLAGGAVAIVALLLALNLTGIAVMLGAVEGRWPPALIWVPACAWLIAAIGAVVAWRASATAELQEVKDELRADADMLALIKKVES